MGKIKIDDTELYYEFHETERPLGTVAFLNGVMASISSWEFFTEAFKTAGYNVLLHDFRGQLLSGKPPGVYTFSRHAEDLLLLLRELGIENPHLVGTSYGGEVALRFAVDYPQVPKTIAVIDSVSETDEMLDAMIDLWIGLIEAGDPVRFFWGMMPTIYSSEFIRDNKQMLTQRAERMKDLPADYFTGQISLYRTFKNDVRITELLPAIRCPSLVVCGELDILKPPRYSRIIASAIPEAEYALIPGAGHVVIFEKPRILDTLLRGFIGKYSS